MGINDNFRYLNIGLPEDIARLKTWGDFAGATRLIDQWLERTDIPEALRGCLTVQREVIARLPLDYPYSKAQALALARKSIPDFSEEEFDSLVDNGQIGWIYVNGEVRFFNRFFETLCKVDAGIGARAGNVFPAGQPSDRIPAAMEEMKQTGKATRRLRFRASLRLKDELFTPGIFLRAHLPIPCACPEQEDIKIESIYPEGAVIAPEDAPQRTICWEETMAENHDFVVEFSYRYTAPYRDTSTMSGAEAQPSFCTEEQAPHIVFTPYIKALTESLTAGLTDPMEKARRFYDFITLNMKYNFMPAYFSLENIPEACARNYSGDCGVFALLFITLCRCAGIPAQWQSGYSCQPNFTAHDWTRFYVAPYGWIHADPSYGVAAVRLKDEQRRKFYFGNLDPFRMVANNAFQTGFTPDKAHWRADPYDNQVGEMETAQRGLRFDEFIRSKELLLCEEEPTCDSNN